MKKLLIHLLLITCLGSFISPAAVLCGKDKKASGIININTSGENGASLQNGNTETEVYPLNIFTLRYF